MIEVCQINSDEDLQTSLEIRRKVFIEEQGVDRPQEIDPGDFIRFLARVDGRPVGTSRLRIEKTLIVFERVATLACTRGQGVGKALIQQMQKVASADYPHHLMVMHAQLHAQPFYEKLGWKALGEPFVEAGVEHILMVFPPPNPDQMLAYHDPHTPALIHQFLHS